MTDQKLDNLARQVILDAARQEYGDWIDELPEQDFFPEFEKEMQRLIQQADHPVRHRCLRTVQLALSLALTLCACSSLDKILSLEEIVENSAGWSNEQLQ